MVIYYDSMNFINVISSRYVLPASEILRAQKDFLEKILKITTRMRGQLFYCLEGIQVDANKNVNSENYITVRFYISVEDESPLLTKEMQFDSYFSLGDVVCCCRLKQIEANYIPKAHAELLDFCGNNNWRPYTNVFYQLGLDDSNRYLMIKVGVCPNSLDGK